MTTPRVTVRTDTQTSDKRDNFKDIWRDANIALLYHIRALHQLKSATAHHLINNCQHHQGKDRGQQQKTVPGHALFVTQWTQSLDAPGREVTYQFLIGLRRP